LWETGAGGLALESVAGPGGTSGSEGKALTSGSTIPTHHPQAPRYNGFKSTKERTRLAMALSRRHFLETSAALAAATSSAPAAQSPRSPNDQLQYALIGAGGMGSEDARSALRQPGVKLVAVADCYDGRLAHAKENWGKDLFTTRDYREILVRKDIDAVLIGTPDHWHSRISVDAMKAGKDVYCEKPMVQQVGDGHEVIDTAKATGRIIQVGSQRVSSVVYQKAKELLASGAIGELNMVEAWWDRNSALGAWVYSIPPDASEQTVDWDRFQGRAPKRPFDAKRVFRWRNYRDYGTGVAGDLFVHLFSGMHFVTGAIGPTRAFATGGLRFWNDGRDVPDVLLGLYDYPKTDRHTAFTLALRVNFVNGAGETSGFRFVGSEGVMTIGGGVSISKTPRETEPGYTIDTFAKATQEEFLKEYRQKYPPAKPSPDSMRAQGDEKYQAPPGYSDHIDHHRNFAAAVRSRKPVVEDATFGFRAAGPALLSNISYFEQRVCHWDPETMTLKG
jgi:predicted dehydrogenase